MGNIIGHRVGLGFGNAGARLCGGIRSVHNLGAMMAEECLRHVSSTSVLQDVTFGTNWVKGIRNLCVLFLTASCECTNNST